MLTESIAPVLAIVLTLTHGLGGCLPSAASLQVSE